MDYNILKIFKYIYSSQWKRKKALYGVLYLTLWMILSGCSSATSGEDPASAEYWLKSQLVETVTSISKIPTKIPSNCWYLMILHDPTQDNKKPATLVNVRVLMLCETV
jgi:hypothetical protein